MKLDFLLMEISEEEEVNMVLMVVVMVMNFRRRSRN